jgi:hypothetical protein
MSHSAYLKAAAGELERSSLDDKPSPNSPEYRLQMLAFAKHISRRLFTLDSEHPLAPVFALRTMGRFLEMLREEGRGGEAVRDELLENLNATLGVERSALVDLLAPRDYARGLSGRGFAALVPRAYFNVHPATKLGAPYRESAYLESWPRAVLLTASDPHRGPVASLVVPLLLFEVLDRAGRGFRPATQSERGFMVRLNSFYRRLTEYRWSVRPSYALYDNGTVLARAVIDPETLTMTEI